MANRKRVVIEVNRGLMSIPRIDERVALAIADDDTVVQAAAAAVDANPTIASLTPGPGEVIVGGADAPVAWKTTARHDTPLDIWPEFDATGSGDGWLSDSYASWLSGLDAHLAPDVSSGDVTRQQVGMDGSGNPLVVYASGSATKPVAMLVSGIHGERIGQRAAMRFFEQFVRSDHPVMAHLRDQFRLVWFVTGTPTTWPNLRTNANGVDISRNFGFWWSKFESTPGTPKGDAPFSEPESQAIRDVIFDVKPSVFIDCHNFGSATGSEVAYGPAQRYVVGAQRFIHEAMQQWSTVYNADGEMSLVEMPEQGGRDPISRNWAQYAMRWVNGTGRGASMVLECSSDLYESTPSKTSRLAMQAYCGAIATVLTSWIHAGVSVAEYPYTYSMGVSSGQESAPTSIASGGTLIDQPNYTEAAYTFSSATPVQWTGPRSRMEIVVPYAPANITINVTGQVFAGPDTTTAGRIFIEPRVNGVAQSARRQIITTSAEPSVYYPVSLSHVVRLDEVKVDNPDYVELIVWRESGTMTRSLQRVFMTVTATPHTRELRSFAVD